MLEIDNLTMRFGGFCAVDRCSFTVEQETITGIIGPNGAGKSTMFNLIAGAFAPTEGQIRFQGRDITGTPAHELFNLGIVRTFQIPHEFGKLTVLENLMMVPPNQPGENLFANWFQRNTVANHEKDVREKAEWVLDFLEIAHVRDVKAANLSGGQKKLLELGRTMMTDAKLVLLDEPAAGVNRTLLKKLSENILRMNKELGYTFCVIEHDMDLISALCHPVICMAQGQVLTQGTFEEVRSNPHVLEAYLGNAAHDNDNAGAAEGESA